MPELLPSEAARFDEVCRLGHDQLVPIAETVALSFADDPIWRWLFSGDQSELTTQQMTAFSRYIVATMVAPREIHGFRDHRAVALWHSPQSAAADAAADSDELRSDFEQNVAPLLHDLAALREFSTAMHAHRPDEPHWYLSTIGTRPGHQGQGTGARLLTTMHNRCDRLGLPIYLESSNPANYAFYHRNGYVETTEFTAAGSPPLRGFRREPA